MVEFKKLVEEGGNYIVRVQSPAGASVTAFAPACAVAASNFKEDWEVTMDQFGHLIALNYVPSNPSCENVNVAQVKDTVQFNTNIRVAYPWRGIRPEIKTGQGGQPIPGAPQGQAQPQAQGGSDKDGDKEPEEEKSFLQKYWLYLAIPVVFMMMNGMPPEEGAGGQGGKPAGPRAPPRRRPA